MKSCPECKATFPDDYAICPKDGAPLVHSSVWQIGTVVRGKYRIQARLGEGGMATVYRAHHELLDELRALKVIKPELAHDEEFMGRFKNEAIMARKLHHPNAVRVDDLDIAEDGLPFIAMELVVGDTIKTLVQQIGPLPVPLALDIAYQVCEALDAAHKLGLIHRDVKPENIVLVANPGGSPIAKILDFGISRLQQETKGTKGLTQTGMVIGTPEYMSPEQSMGKRAEEIDGRSDLYSLGVVMYRMLTGELPFNAETTLDMMLQHLRTPPKPPHLLKPGLGIPEPVSMLVIKALEKSRAKRFRTGAEMAAAIKKVRGIAPVASRKVEWDSLRPTATASFGTEHNIPELPAALDPAASDLAASAPLPAGNVAAAAAAPGAEKPAEKPLFRTSARVDKPPEFPVRAVALIAAAVVALSVVAYSGRKHFVTKHAAGQPATEPARPSPSAPVEPPKAAESSQPSPDAEASSAETGSEHKALTYDEQAKVVELNSLATIYYREGGCAKALSTYQQILEIDPHNRRAYTAVQKCYAKIRNSVEPPLPRVPVPDNSIQP